MLRAHVPLMRESRQGVAESRLVHALRMLVREYGYCRANDVSQANRDGDARGDTGMVAVAQRYLHDHLAVPVRLRQLADLCGVNTFALIRAFHRVVGVSPYAYFVQLRVNRAQAMLCQGSSMADVVYSCGFADQSHFTRTFKRVIGVPPGRYVRAVRRSAA
jgi:transcriptional regulator GlxA family with amidase domain